jgi:hypothetical protein
MTLEQSEFQQLVEVLIELVDRYRGNPAVLEAILAEFRDLYKKVPIYPSIVALCLEKIVRPAKLDDLREGEEVVMTTKGGKTVSGRVAEITPNDIKLAEASELTLLPIAEKLSVTKTDVEDLKKIVREILAKEWPTLNFKEE